MARDERCGVAALQHAACSGTCRAIESVSWAESGFGAELGGEGTEQRQRCLKSHQARIAAQHGHGADAALWPKIAAFLKVCIAQISFRSLGRRSQAARRWTAAINLCHTLSRSSKLLPLLALCCSKEVPMPLVQRAFQGAVDWPDMLAVVQAQPSDHLHLIDLPYRLCSWAFDDPANCSLWQDATGQVLAWAVLQSPFWSLDYAIHPAAPATMLQAVLRWADHRAEASRTTPFARPMWFINGFRSHPHAQEIEAFGFHSQAAVGAASWTKVLFRRDATHLPERRPVPNGFRIRPLKGTDEVDAYVALHRAVFQSESMTSAWRERTLRHPAYQPDLDLVVVDAEEQLAGFCIGWYTPRGPDGQPAGQIEPMGIRADVRGRGLGKALLLDCLHQLRSAGATSLFVETDNDRATAFSHYQAVGFRVLRDVIVYRKDYAANQS